MGIIGIVIAVAAVIYLLIGLVLAFVALCDPEGRNAKWCIPMIFLWIFLYPKLNRKR